MTRSVWIEGYEGKYKIFDDGRILSFWGRSPRFIRPNNNQRYFQNRLSNDGGYKVFRIHWLVAKHFVPGYKPGLQVNHKNGNKLDNRAENLEWVTPRINTIHAIKNGLMKFSRACPMINKPVIGTHTATGEELNFKSVTSAASYVGGHQSSISHCCRGKEKTCKGYKWRYA
jgi:hypothetical protein